MTGIPQPKAMTKTYAATWDAWNRLVRLVDSTTGQTGAQYRYDGQNWRIAQTTSQETRDYFYSAAWQVLEEHTSGSSSSSSSSSSGSSPPQAACQYVWGERYVDDLVLRDRDNGGVFNERLYALQDANWNVVALTDKSGGVVERYGYSAYGTPTYYDASWSSIRSTSQYNNSILTYPLFSSFSS